MDQGTSLEVISSAHHTFQPRICEFVLLQPVFQARPPVPPATASCTPGTGCIGTPFQLHSPSEGNYWASKHPPHAVSHLVPPAAATRNTRGTFLTQGLITSTLLPWVLPVPASGIVPSADGSCVQPSPPKSSTSVGLMFY
jgi:hypothetical protein